MNDFDEQCCLPPVDFIFNTQIYGTLESIAKDSSEKGRTDFFEFLKEHENTSLLSMMPWTYLIAIAIKANNKWFIRDILKNHPKNNITRDDLTLYFHCCALSYDTEDMVQFLLTIMFREEITLNHYARYIYESLENKDEVAPDLFRDVDEKKIKAAYRRLPRLFHTNFYGIRRAIYSPKLQAIAKNTSQTSHLEFMQLLEVNNRTGLLVGIAWSNFITKAIAAENYWFISRAINNLATNNDIEENVALFFASCALCENKQDMVDFLVILLLRNFSQFYTHKDKIVNHLKSKSGDPAYNELLKIFETSFLEARRKENSIRSELLNCAEEANSDNQLAFYKLLAMHKNDVMDKNNKIPLLHNIDWLKLIAIAIRAENYWFISEVIVNLLEKPLSNDEILLIFHSCLLCKDVSRMSEFLLQQFRNNDLNLTRDQYRLVMRTLVNRCCFSSEIEFDTFSEAHENEIKEEEIEIKEENYDIVSGCLQKHYSRSVPSVIFKENPNSSILHETPIQNVHCNFTPGYNNHSEIKEVKNREPLTPMNREPDGQAHAKYSRTI